jgi:hypothetical protein
MTHVSKTHWFGILGTVFGCLALLFAVLPTWVLPLVMPPKPVERVVIDTAQKFKDHLVAQAKGIEYTEPERKTDWYALFSAAAIILGALAIVFAAISFVAREPWRYAGAGAALGVGAVLFQFSLMVAGALIAILLIAVVLHALGL